MTLPAIKRILRPARPLLLPIYRAASSRRKAARSSPPAGADLAFPEPRPDRPIWPLSAAQFSELLERDRYYNGRGGYMGVAATIAAELIEKYDLRTALELGPNVRPLISGADAMDYRERPGLEAEGTLVVHDATKAPWPVADGQYDLFVALQVFEHLGAEQSIAFAEVARVAKHAILSLPIDWTMRDPSNVHHQVSHERVLSWFAPRTPTRIVEGTPAPKRRLIYVFENLDKA